MLGTCTRYSDLFCEKKEQQQEKRESLRKVIKGPCVENSTFWGPGIFCFLYGLCIAVEIGVVRSWKQNGKKESKLGETFNGETGFSGVL